MILLNEINQIKVVDYSVMENELEYVLVENTPENRKKIDLALAMQFNWCIVDMGDNHFLTAGGSEILSEHSEDDKINVCGIIFDNLPNEVTSKIGWSLETGFILSEDKVITDEKLFQEVKKEVSKMIRQDKYIVIEFDVDRFAWRKKISLQQAKRIGEKIVDEFYDNVSIKKRHLRK